MNPVTDVLTIPQIALFMRSLRMVEMQTGARFVLRFAPDGSGYPLGALTIHD